MAYSIACNRFIATAAVAAVICISHPVHAQSAYPVDIPKQSLAKSLRMLGSSTRTNIGFDPEVVSGHIAPGIHGTYSVTQALDMLVRDAGLSVKTIGSGSYLVVRGEAPAARVQLTAQVAPRSRERATTEFAPPAPREMSEEPPAAEIVVTASKLGSALQRAPVAASEISADDLLRAGIGNIREVTVRIPSLSFSNSSGYGQSYIRGVGADFALAGLESPVATYVDGVYLQRQAGSALDLVDISSVQVLKGPQGTLYGRNATGGAILVQTANPTSNMEGRVSGEYGRFDNKRIEAVVNLPVSDVLAFRFAGMYQSNDGYVRNRALGLKFGATERYYGRAKVGWTPTDDFTAVLTLAYSDTKSNYYRPREDLDAPRCLACTVYGITPDRDGFYSATGNDVGRDPQKYVASSLNLDYDGENLSFSSATGYRRGNALFLNDIDGTTAPLFNAFGREKGPTFTHDMYVRTKFDGKLNILVGASYLRDRDTQTVLFSGDAFGQLPDITTTNKVKIESFSVYGELVYEIVPGLKFTAGARFNQDVKRVGTVNSANAVIGFGLPPAFRTFNLKGKFRDVTPRAVLTYETPTTLYYASFNRGAKSGGFGSPTITPTNSVDSEVLDSFELGVKTKLLDNLLTFNADVFYGSYRNLQVQLIDASTGTTLSQNAGKARQLGLEVDVTVKPSRDFSLATGFVLQDNKFLQFRNAAIFAPAGGGAPGFVQTSADLSGFPLPRSPRFAGYIALDHNLALAGDWAARTNVNLKYTSKFDFVPGAAGPLRHDRQSGYATLDASLMFVVPGDRIEFGVYGSNLTGTKYYEYSNTSAFGAVSFVGRPTMYGVRSKLSF